MRQLATIGYQDATVQSLLAALQQAGVELVVDVRALANSRRPGFAKTRLSANLQERGIGYLHLRGLGTPADGRAAARAGDFDRLRTVYLDHLRSTEARDDLDRLLETVRSGTRVCLLCLEAAPAHCHRTLVAMELAGREPVSVVHLAPAEPT